MAAGVTAATAFCTLIAAATSAVAAAQARLPDPTRPPEANAATAGQGEAKPQAGHRLQSVLISAQRKLAVIDGRTVSLGGRIDDAVVVAITETGVTLRRGREIQVLQLNAGVQKKDVRP